MKTELKYGMMAGLAYISWNAAECSLGFYTQLLDWQLVSKSLSVVFPTFFLVLGLLEESKTQAAGAGILGKGVQIAFVTALVNLVGMILYFEYINPNFNQDMLHYATQEALRNGANIALARQNAELMHSMGGILLSNFVSNLSVGIVVSVALSFYLPKPRVLETEFAIEKTNF